MATSDALATVVDLLSLFEDNGGDVREVSVAEANDIVGTAEVEFPVFDESELTDGVGIDVVAAGLEEGTVELSLELTLAPNDRSSADATIDDGQDHADTVTDPNRAPATPQPSYKDPRELEKVYEEFETFPEMTEALGVDVTPETVRRYMVKYDIHNPVTADRMSDRMQTPSKVPAESDASGSGTEGADQVSAEDTGTAGNTARDDATGADSSTEESDASPLEAQSVAELLEEGAAGGESPIVADGSGIPRSLTVAELADVLERSRTVSEAQRSLGLEYQQTRHMLRKLGLVEFVTGRLAASHSKVPPKLVAKRLTDYSDETSGT